MKAVAMARTSCHLHIPTNLQLKRLRHLLAIRQEMLHFKILIATSNLQLQGLRKIEWLLSRLQTSSQLKSLLIKSLPRRLCIPDKNVKLALLWLQVE